MKIVIATDGSVEADIAEVVLKRLPFPKGTEFTVAMVTQLPVMAALSLSPVTAVAGEHYAVDEWQIKLNIARQTTGKVAERLRTEGFTAEAIVLEGNTADELLSLAKRQGSDVIVAGCGGSSSFAAFLLGSVSRQLVLYSQASVLIGRRYGEAPAEGTYNRLQAKNQLDVLVAVDDSTGAELVIDTLAKLSTPVFGSVYVTCIQPLEISPVSPLYQADKARIEGIAAKAAEKISRSAHRVEIVSGFGRPSAEICRIAAEKQVDLIMLAANRHGFIERLILGSCAYETATSAACSVMILRDVLDFASH